MNSLGRGWKNLNFVRRWYCGKIDWEKLAKPSVFPERQAPFQVDESRLPSMEKIDDDLLHHLEQLSLVRFSDQAAVHHLKKAIGYADQLTLVETNDVEPMYTVLENEILRLRPDEVSQGNCRDDILRNATKRVEEYFVAPPGNIPLEPRTEKLEPREIKELSKKRKL